MFSHRFFQRGIVPRLSYPEFRDGIAARPGLWLERLVLPAFLGLALAFLPPFSEAVLASPQPPEQAHEPGHDAAHVVRLSAEQLKQSGIRVETAGPGQLVMSLNLPGQVMINTDRLVRVVPRVAGVVREIKKNAWRSRQGRRDHGGDR